MTTKNTNPAGNPKIGEVRGVLIKPTKKDDQDVSDRKQTEPDLMGELGKAKRRVKRP